jgi:aquaporin Z
MNPTNLLTKFAAEIIGTLVFLTIILKATDKYAVVAGLLAAILFMGNVTGGHFNPAVSLMGLIQGNLTIVDFLVFIVAQFLGAVGATQLVKIL